MTEFVVIADIITITGDYHEHFKWYDSFYITIKEKKSHEFSANRSLLSFLYTNQSAHRYRCT